MWTARVYRNHNSLTVTLNKGMCRELGIRHGDILMFGQFGDETDEVTMRKLTWKEHKLGRHKGNSNRPDPGGRT